jgi:hypothetical protein
MADNKRPSIKFITPRGVAIFPKLSKPDTKFKAEGEYSCKLRLQPDALPAELVEKLVEMRDTFAAETRDRLTAEKKGAKAKTLKVREGLTTDETDKDSGESTGFVILNAKMTAAGVSKKDGKPWSRSPKLFDAKGTPLKANAQIWGGSELKLAVEAIPYYTPKDNEVGISFRLEAVQVLVLVSGTAKDAAGYGFGEEEGYAEEAAEKFDDSAGTTGASTAASGDEF